MPAWCNTQGRRASLRAGWPEKRFRRFSSSSWSRYALSANQHYTQVASELEAQSEGRLEFNRLWKPWPKNDHLVVQMLLTVMEGRYAINPCLGAFKWETRQWGRLPGRNPIWHPIHQWMDIMQFHTRGKPRIDRIAAEVGAYLEQWDRDNPELISSIN